MVKHMSMDNMWADMNTKPNLGCAFEINRSHMMNCDKDHSELNKEANLHTSENDPNLTPVLHDIVTA